MSNKQNNYTNKAPITVTTGGNALLPLNLNRTSLILFNQGPSSVNIYMNTAAAFITLTAGQRMDFTHAAPLNEINGTTTSGTAVVTVWES